MILSNIRRLQKHSVSTLLIASLIVASWPSLANYLRLEFSLNFLWIFLLPFILYVKQPGIISWRYLWAILAAITLYFLTPSYFFLYLLFWFTVFLVIEVRHGKINAIAPLVVIVTTPVFKYFFDLFGIPIRRMLTTASAKLIGLFQSETVAEGNSIWYQGNLFDVDPACAGLKLAITSVLIIMFLISHFERLKKKELNFRQFALIGMLCLVFIGSANLYRIIILTITGVGPESAWHDIFGMLCMLLFTVIPMYFITGNLYRYASDIKSKTNEQVRLNYKAFNYLLILPTALLILLNHFQKPITDQKADSHLLRMQVIGYSKSILPNNTVSFTNDYSIIYVKPSKGIFRSEHHPSFCWRGSGFTFEDEHTLEISGEYINLSRLSKDNETLWTAWWYDNGHSRTQSQIQWRLDMISGAAPYRLFNVTTADKDELIHQVNYIKDLKLLSKQQISAKK